MLSLLAGYVSYRWIERPILRLKTRLGVARPSAPSIEATAAPSAD
jgi:hypothetical protein